MKVKIVFSIKWIHVKFLSWLRKEMNKKKNKSVQNNNFLSLSQKNKSKDHSTKLRRRETKLIIFPTKFVFKMLKLWPLQASEIKRMQNRFVGSLLSMIFRIIFSNDDKNCGKIIVFVAAEPTPISNY